jgi:hypothetical protein
VPSAVRYLWLSAGAVIRAGRPTICGAVQASAPWQRSRRFR